MPLPRGSREGYRERTLASLVDEDDRRVVGDEVGEEADVAELL